MPLEPPQPRAIILFDGVCNLCNRSVNYIIDHDRAGRFRFAAQQSEAGQTIAREYALDKEQLKTVVLIESGRCYVRSGAVVRIARKLSGPARLLGVGIVIPPFIRDALYEFVARRRYRWFGRSDTCRVPTAEIRERFL